MLLFRLSPVSTTSQSLSQEYPTPFSRSNPIPIPQYLDYFLEVVGFLAVYSPISPIMHDARDIWLLGPESQPPPQDDLHEVSLDDNVETREPLQAGSRPECLKNIFHECIFVSLVALAAATPVFLQRSVVVVAGSLADALQMTPAQMAWATASSGYVYL